MANQNGIIINVEEAKAKAKERIDKYEDDTIPELHAFIHGLNNIENVRSAFLYIQKINTRITHRSTFEGELSPEYEAKLAEWKLRVTAALSEFEQDTIPRLRRLINRETDIDNLREIVADINYFYQMTNSAEFAGY